MYMSAVFKNTLVVDTEWVVGLCHAEAGHWGAGSAGSQHCVFLPARSIVVGSFRSCFRSALAAVGRFIMAYPLFVDGFLSVVLETCAELDAYASLRAVSREFRAQVPNFSLEYILTWQICVRLRDLCSTYLEDGHASSLPVREYHVRQLRGWVLSLRVLLRWSDSADGCASLVGRHVSDLDELLGQCGSVALRAEASELLREVGVHVASVRALLASRHETARSLISGMMMWHSGVWEASDEFEEYDRQCVVLESKGKALAEIPQEVLWADYAICALDLFWAGDPSYEASERTEYLGWISVLWVGAWWAHLSSLPYPPVGLPWLVLLGAAP